MKISFKNLIKYFFLLFISVNLSSCKEENYEAKINFNNGWKFTKLKEITTPDEAFSQPNFDATSWKDVSLPHTTNIEPQTVNDQWQGIAWYRKSFNVPVNPSKKK